MKKYITILFFTLLPFYYSCISNDEPPKPGTVTAAPGISALNNGLDWEAALRDTLANDSLELYAVSKVNILKIKFPVAASTTYELLGKEGMYYIRNNTGAVTETFKLDSTYINTVKVQLNTTNQTITGGFNLRFVIDKSVPGNDTTGTKTISFTNGYYIVPTN